MSGQLEIGVTIVELIRFRRDAEKIFTEAEFDDLADFLSRNPLCGDLIPAAGGVRKFRWRARGNGKRSGARVIYFFHDTQMPLFLLAVYAKGEKENLTMQEREHMHRFVEALLLERNKSVDKKQRGE